MSSQQVEEGVSPDDSLNRPYLIKKMTRGEGSTIDSFSNPEVLAVIAKLR